MSYFSSLIIAKIQEPLTLNIPFTTELSCSICLEPYKELAQHDAVRLGCQHAFGRKCIQTWASQSTKCPACRSIFLPESLWADENTPQRRAYRRIVALCEDSGVCCGLILGLIICSYIITIVIYHDNGAICGFITLFICNLLTGYHSTCRDVAPWEFHNLSHLHSLINSGFIDDQHHAGIS